MDRYVWSFDLRQEIWYKSGETISECIAQAREELPEYKMRKGLDEVSTVYVGEIANFNPHVEASYIIDILQSSAYDECGEISQDWLYNIKKEVREELETELNKTIGKWLYCHDLLPGFGPLVNVKEYDLKTGKEIKEEN